MEKGVLGHFGKDKLVKREENSEQGVRFQAGSINIRRAVRGEGIILSG